MKHVFAAALLVSACASTALPGTADSDPLAFAEPQDGINYPEPVPTHTFVDGRRFYVQMSSHPAIAAICDDGWVSYSRDQRVACMGHGGIREWLSGRGLRIGDTALNGSLTLDHARSLWGQSDSQYGPQLEYVVYPVEGDGAGEVWLWFQPEAPHLLRRALLIDTAATMPSQRGRDIINLIPETERRTVDDIPTRRPLRVRDVADVWGPPDGTSGSGVPYWVYGLADGGEAWLSVSYRDPETVAVLRIMRADGTRQEIVE